MIPKTEISLCKSPPRCPYPERYPAFPASNFGRSVLSPLRRPFVWPTHKILAPPLTTVGARPRGRVTWHIKTVTSCLRNDVSVAATRVVVLTSDYWLAFVEPLAVCRRRKRVAQIS